MVGRLFTVQSLYIVAAWADDPIGEAYQKHLARVQDYIWVCEDGMKIQVSNIH